MPKKRIVDVNRVNAIENSRALKRLRFLRAQVEQTYWDVLLELMGVPPDPSASSVANPQPTQSKGERP